jgi:hypothetical protein
MAGTHPRDQPVADAAFPFYDDGGSIRAGPARVAASCSREAGISGELRPGVKTELGHIGTAGVAEVLVSAWKHGGQGRNPKALHQAETPVDGASTRPQAGSGRLISASYENATWPKAARPRQPAVICRGWHRNVAPHGPSTCTKSLPVMEPVWSAQIFVHDSNPGKVVRAQFENRSLHGKNRWLIDHGSSEAWPAMRGKRAAMTKRSSSGSVRHPRSHARVYSCLADELSPIIL